MQLTKRQKNIMDILKNHEYIKADSIAKKLQISEKTARVSIAEINSLCKEPVILSLKGKGYQLSPDVYIEEADISVTAGEKRQLSLLLHILSNANTDYYELADSFYISESTLEKDVTIINAQIHKHFDDISVKRKKNQLFMEGSEEEKRSVLLNFLMRELEEYDFSFTSIEHCFAHCDIMMVKETILGFIKAANLLLKDIEIIHLILYSAIMIERVKGGHTIIQFIDIAVKSERSRQLCRLLEAEHDILLPESEKEFIRSLFQNKMDMELLAQTQETVHKEFLNEALNDINNKYNIDLRNDGAFQQNLLVHLMDLYHRVKTEQFIDNPLIGDIKNTFPLIYDISVYLTMKIQEYFGIRLREDEIGYISLHIVSMMDRNNTRKKRIVIISPNRGAVSGYIEQALLRHFNQSVEIFGTYSLFAMDEIQRMKPDLILTTTPLKEKFKCPVFQCSNLINAQELDKIKQLLANQNFGILEARLELLHQFDNRLFYPLLDIKNKEDIIQYLCSKLVEEGYCDKDYVNHVMERESIAATSFGNFVAIPHAVEMAAAKNGIAVATLKNDVPWGDNKVRIVFLFALSSQSRNLTLFYDVIAKSLDNGSRMKDIIQYTEFNSFIEAFLNLTKS